MNPGFESSVYYPDSLNDTLNLLRQRPDCVIGAGNTFLRTHTFSKADLANRDIVNLQRVEELKRIVRSDRYLELGAMVSLERILSMEPHLLPASIRQTIISTVPFPVRTLATLGGNICNDGDYFGLRPILAAWDARLELRKASGMRFVPAKGFGQNPDNSLDHSELLTRVRIPLGRWNYSNLRRIKSHNEKTVPSLAVGVLARINRQTIEEIRIVWCFSDNWYHIEPDADVLLTGVRIPVHSRDGDRYIDEASKSILAHGDATLDLVLPRLSGLARSLLKQLPEEIEVQNDF